MPRACTNAPYLLIYCIIRKNFFRYTYTFALEIFKNSLPIRKFPSNENYPIYGIAFRVSGFKVGQVVKWGIPYIGEIFFVKINSIEGRNYKNEAGMKAPYYRTWMKRKPRKTTLVAKISNPGVYCPALQPIHIKCYLLYVKNNKNTMTVYTIYIYR